MAMQSGSICLTEQLKMKMRFYLKRNTDLFRLTKLLFAHCLINTSKFPHFVLLYCHPELVVLDISVLFQTNMNYVDREDIGASLANETF